MKFNSSLGLWGEVEWMLQGACPEISAVQIRSKVGSLDAESARCCEVFAYCVIYIFMMPVVLMISCNRKEIKVLSFSVDAALILLFRSENSGGRLIGLRMSLSFDDYAEAVVANGSSYQCWAT